MENLEKHVAKLSIIWCELANNEWALSKSAEKSLKNFLKYLHPSDVYEAMIIASEKLPENTGEEVNERFAYFCGICWNWIKNDKSSNIKVAK